MDKQGASSPTKDKKDRTSFWTTLPGVLTGIAALITAVTGAIVLMRPPSSAAPTPSPTVPPTLIAEAPSAVPATFLLTAWP